MKISVMSFNLRVNVESDGINSLNNRRGRILETVKKHSPDIIGFQEVEDDTREWLRDSLPEYFVAGCGRNFDYMGESVPVAFRRDSFEMISCENFALSPTPEIMGTRFIDVGQSECPRMATALKLKHREVCEPFIFVNTHADHHAPEARALEFSLLIKYMSQKGDRCILTGDLNTLPSEPILRIFSENQSLAFTEAPAEIEETFHAFGRVGKSSYWLEKYGEEKVKIDYIFTTPSISAKSAFAVEDEGVDGVYISDHRPIIAFVEI